MKVELHIHGKALAGNGKHNQLYLESHGDKSAVWKIKSMYDDVVEIRSHDDHYVGCDQGGRAYLHHAHHDGGDTKFHMEHLGSNTVAFRSHHGHYLTVQSHGGWFGHTDRGSDSVFQEVIIN